MKKFTLAVFFDYTIESGGSFQQSLNNILLAKSLVSNEVSVKIITTKKENLKILKKYELKYLLYLPNIFFRTFMKFEETSNIFIYKLIKFFFKKTHFEKFLEINHVDLIYFVAQSGYANFTKSINYIYTLFDLCHRDFPEFPEVRSNKTFEDRENEFQKNLPRAVAVLTESNLGRENAIDRYRLNPNRVYVFQLNPSPTIQSKNIEADNKIEKEFIDIKKKYDLKYNYIFYPAQFWAHKNHIYILKALNILRNESSISLGAIFSGNDKGNLSYIKDMTKKLNLESHVRFAGFVPNEEMTYLYSQSLALVMPTYFGPTNIPPLEAFKLNVPVLYSDLPGLRDQVNNAALLLDLDDPNSLVLNLKKLLSSNEERNNLINKGKLRYTEIVSKNNNHQILKKIIEDFRIRRDCWK